MKPILPTTPSLSTDRKTSRTNLTGLKAADQRAKQLSPKAAGPASQGRSRPKAADLLIHGLAACEGPHLKALVLNNSYLAPVHRALQGLLAL